MKIENFVAEETYGSTIRRCYNKYVDSENIHAVDLNNIRWKSFKSIFASVFLPHGYPESVSGDYLQYQIWDSVQAFASSITGGIATHAVLKGVGVGDENASALAATMTWIMKDGISMVSRIVFSWLKGTELDSNCKKWRLFADILNDFAIFIELISSYFKASFFYVICFSGLMKSIVGVAGGATRAAVIQHQARKNNMADVSAKDGSQETLLNLVALLFNLIIIPHVANNERSTWVLYFSMTFLHIVANVYCVKSVNIETFNKERFKLFMEYYTYYKCPSVKEINEMESVWLSPFHKKLPVLMGASFSKIIQSKNWDEIKDLLNLYEKHDYILCINEKTRKVYVCLRRSVSALTQLKAMFQAYLILETFPSRQIKIRDYSEAIKNYETLNYYLGSFPVVDKMNPLEKLSKRVADKYFKNVKRAMEDSGWDVNTVMFNTDLWHVHW